RLGPELRLRGQEHQRPGHEEHHDDVEDRGEAEGEREATDLTDGQDVEHGGGDEADRVTGKDGPAGTGPTARHGGTETSSLADLVLDPFEEDDERVGGHAD